MPQLPEAQAERVWLVQLCVGVIFQFDWWSLCFNI